MNKATLIGLAMTLGLASFGAGAATTPAAVDKPIFCKLSSEVLRARLGELRAHFLTEIVAVDELENGFRFWVTKSPEHLVMLARFVDFESQCCGFMDFSISLTGGAERVSLSLTGPDGTKAFLEDMMASVEFNWRASS